MIVIVLTACSILHGAHCREFQLPQFTSSATPFECMRYGQKALVDWSAMHPNWSVSRWSCVPGSRLKAKA